MVVVIAGSRTYLGRIIATFAPRSTAQPFP
jgi:hypothetical protein